MRLASGANKTASYTVTDGEGQHSGCSSKGSDSPEPSMKRLEGRHSKSGDVLYGGSPSCYGDPNEGFGARQSSAWFGSVFVSDFSSGNPAAFGLKPSKRNGSIGVPSGLLSFCRNIANVPRCCTPNNVLGM